MPVGRVARPRRHRRFRLMADRSTGGSAGVNVIRLAPLPSPQAQLPVIAPQQKIAALMFGNVQKAPAKRRYFFRSPCWHAHALAAFPKVR
jgi:hypothetical protein